MKQFKHSSIQEEFLGQIHLIEKLEHIIVVRVKWFSIPSLV